MVAAGNAAAACSLCSGFAAGPTTRPSVDWGRSHVGGVLKQLLGHWLGIFVKPVRRSGGCKNSPSVKHSALFKPCRDRTSKVFRFAKSSQARIAGVM